jgi:hypothetical protein
VGAFVGGPLVGCCRTLSSIDCRIDGLELGREFDWTLGTTEGAVKRRLGDELFGSEG